MVKIKIRNNSKIIIICEVDAMTGLNNKADYRGIQIKDFHLVLY